MSFRLYCLIFCEPFCLEVTKIKIKQSNPLKISSISPFSIFNSKFSCMAFKMYFWTHLFPLGFDGCVIMMYKREALNTTAVVAEEGLCGKHQQGQRELASLASFHKAASPFYYRHPQTKTVFASFSFSQVE